MKRLKIYLALLTTTLTGCVATPYTFPKDTDDVAQITVTADGEGALIPGMQVRFWHIKNVGECGVWEIEGERTLMHTIEVGGIFGIYDDKPKTLPITIGKSNYLVTAQSGDLHCALLSEFTPEKDKNYTLHFEGVLEAFNTSHCKIELTGKNGENIQSFKSKLCYKPW